MINVLAFRLYPNPAKEQITIDAPVSFNKIEVYSTDGKMVFEKFYKAGIQTSTIGLKLSKGIYLMKLSNDKSFMTSKFVIE